MVRIALIGLGKMGLSHFAILNAHPGVQLAAVCDSTAYMLDIIGKYTQVRCYGNYDKLLEQETLDAVLIATPSRLHAAMVKKALDRGLHVFCEKPFCLKPEDSAALALLAEQRKLVGQVGYHYRYVAAYEELGSIIRSGLIGRVNHVKVEAYGPVVLKPQAQTWRSSSKEGGGCLYDYACHGVDLIAYLIGPPRSVRGTVLNRIFSRDVDDQVHSTFFYDDGGTATLSANWSDASVRKMTTRVNVWGEKGRIYADRQELQLYLAPGAETGTRFRPGWNSLYITDLERDIWYYLRGEEYSAQIDGFVRDIEAGAAGRLERDGRSTFATAAETDRIVGLMIADASRLRIAEQPSAPGPNRLRGWNMFSRLRNS